jgi:hypothetical protein
VQWLESSRRRRERPDARKDIEQASWPWSSGAFRRAGGVRDAAAETGLAPSLSAGMNLPCGSGHLGPFIKLVEPNPMDCLLRFYRRIPPARAYVTATVAPHSVLPLSTPLPHTGNKYGVCGGNPFPSVGVCGTLCFVWSVV